ncbi:MAG TPA: peptidoglycan-binding protein [Allocoleopsis sp.]
MRKLLIGVSLVCISSLLVSERAIATQRYANASNPHPLTPSPPGEGGNLYLTVKQSAVLSQNITRPGLKIGSQGETVLELQAVLKLLGYYNGKIDGFYSENTAQSVAIFQSTVGLDPDGVVGNETWNRLFPIHPDDVNISGTQSNSEQKPPKVNTNPKPTNPKPINPKPINPKTTNPKPTTVKPKTTTVNKTESSELPILRLGMQGPGVEKLQKRLKVLGFFDSSITGYFGENTEKAVKLAQQKFKLEPDGIVGLETWRLLLR